MKDEDDTITLTIDWMTKAYAAISAAKGSPAYVIEQFPRHLLHTLIANKIYLTH